MPNVLIDRIIRDGDDPLPEARELLISGHRNGLPDSAVRDARCIRFADLFLALLHGAAHRNDLTFLVAIAFDDGVEAVVALLRYLCTGHGPAFQTLLAIEE